MADEDDEFFEASEDLPPSPEKAQKAAGRTEGYKLEVNDRQVLRPSGNESRDRSQTAGERNRPASTSRGGDFAPGDFPPGNFTRDRSATVGSAPLGGFLDADLSVWKSGPTSVRERRERFWQSQGGVPLPGAAGSNLPPQTGKLPTRRGSASQGRVSGSENDVRIGGALEKRRSSEGERRSTIGFDAKLQQSELLESAARTLLPSPVAFMVSSQGITPVGDVGGSKGSSALTSALSDLAPKLSAAQRVSLGGGQPQAETTPHVYNSHSPDYQSKGRAEVTGPEASPNHSSEIQPVVSPSVPIASQSRVQPEGQSSVISSSAPVQFDSDHMSRRPPFSTIPSSQETPPTGPPVVTAKARPWPKRHQRTPSGSEAESYPSVTPPPSGGASPLAPKTPLLQGVTAAKHLLGQVANHLSHKGGNKSPKAKGPSDLDDSSGSRVGTELERDVLRLGVPNAAEPTPPEPVSRSVSEPGPGLASPGTNVAVEVVYRIKNLDTGKEFFLEHSASDGGNRVVRDANSGKELSMDEVEDSLGLSPVSRELQRREMLAFGEGEDSWEDTEVGRPGAESDPGSGGAPQKKKRGWLNKTLKKGAAYYEKGRRKLQRDPDTEGSGSDTDRRPFVHGRGFPDARTVGWGPGYEPGPNGKGSVKVHVQKKAYKELTDVRVGQEIKAHEGPIWCMKFNSDGRFLATGGKDGLVKVWEVVDKLPPTPLQASGDFDELVSSPSHHSSGGVTDDVSADVARRTSFDRSSNWGASFWLADVAYRTLRGHTSDVLELSWSKNTQFLLSSSMDTTVRLWHVSMDECLRVFPHSDFVTCLDFNPVDDKYFISGSLDNKIRIWNIPEHRVVDWTDMREMVTACTYTSDGSGAIVGSYEGTCRFYSTGKHMLQLDGSLEVRSTRGKNAQGKKVTGVECMPGDPRKILVTSNDSRLRVYDGMKLCCKYKGHANANSQKVATFNASGDYLVCPSEDGCVYVWSTVNSYVPPYGGFRKDRNQSCEYFYNSGVNVAVAWSGPKAASSDSEGGQTKSRSRANSAGNSALRGEITSVSGIRVPGKGAREVPPGSWPKEALVARGEPKASEGVPGARNGPGPWAEPQEESGRLENTSEKVSEAQTAAEVAVAAAAGVGLVIVTASYQGEIRTFKNFGRPVWL